MSGSVDAILRARERNRAWCEQHRSVRRRQPWLFGAPPYVGHLPGGALPLRVRPLPERPRLEHSRHLHGAISRLVGMGHSGDMLADFALLPWADGWGVYFRDDTRALRLAAKMFHVHLWGTDAALAFGPLHRIKAPVVTRRGRQRVRMDAITPVCVRETQAGIYTAPTAAVIRSTLEAWMSKRVGVRCDQDNLRVELVSRATLPATVHLGGKYGAVRGFVGSVELDVNAPALWLLLCAERIGLGGRTAFGFGRIHVTA